jgi:hypothetical protein
VTSSKIARESLSSNGTSAVHDMVENLERLADIRQLIALLARTSKV